MVAYGWNGIDIKVTPASRMSCRHPQQQRRALFWCHSFENGLGNEGKVPSLNGSLHDDQQAK
jgi:hypothetical protein